MKLTGCELMCIVVTNGLLQLQYSVRDLNLTFIYKL